MKKNRKIIIGIIGALVANIFAMSNTVQAAGKMQGICLGIYNHELWMSDGIPRSDRDCIKIMDGEDVNSYLNEKVYSSKNKKNLCFFQQIVDNKEGSLYEINLESRRNGSEKQKNYTIKIDSDVSLENVYVYDDGTVLYTKENDNLKKSIYYFDKKTTSVVATEVKNLKICDNLIIYSMDTSSSEPQLDDYVTGQDLYLIEKDDLNNERVLASNIYEYYVYDAEHIFYSKITESMREFLGDEGDPIYALYLLDCLSGKETKIGENVQTDSRDDLFEYGKLCWTEDDGQETYVSEFVEDDVQTEESKQYMQSLETFRYVHKPVTLYLYNCITNKIVKMADNVKNEPLNQAASSGNWAIMFWKQKDVKVKMSDVIKTSQKNEFSIEYAAKFLVITDSPDWKKLYISFNGKKPQEINLDIAAADEDIYVTEFKFDSKADTVSLEVEGLDTNLLVDTEKRSYTAQIQGGKVGKFIRTDITDQEDSSVIDYDSQIFMEGAVCGRGTVRMPNGDKIEKNNREGSFVGTLKFISSTGEINIISDTVEYWCVFENGNIIYTDNNILHFFDGKRSIDLGVHAECFAYIIP